MLLPTSLVRRCLFSLFAVVLFLLDVLCASCPPPPLPPSRSLLPTQAMSRTHERAAHTYADWDEVTEALSASFKAIHGNLPNPLVSLAAQQDERQQQPRPGSRDAFYIILPMLIVLSTFLFLLLLFLVCVILLRRRRGIMLRDHDGPIDMSREDLIEGEGGFEGVETRWMETVSDAERRAYLRSKGNQPT